MTRRTMLAAIGAAIGQRRPPAAVQVEIRTIITAPDARTPEQAKEDAAMYLWIRLVDRFIDPKTKTASFSKMRAAFLADVKSWASVI